MFVINRSSCRRKAKTSNRGKLGMSHSLGWTCMGVWHGLSEMNEREPRPAEALASVFAEQLTMTAASGLIDVTGGTAQFDTTLV
jgi:hypothetical protein